MQQPLQGVVGTAVLGVNGAAATRAPRQSPAQGGGRGGGKATSAGSGAEATQCAFCGRGVEAAASLGPLLEFKAPSGPSPVAVHTRCAQWAPQVYQPDPPTKDTQHGFAGVVKEVRRAAGLRCPVCRKGGAAIGCQVDSCRRSYHLPCLLGVEGARMDLASWGAYCPEHADVAPETATSPQQLQTLLSLAALQGPEAAVAAQQQQHQAQAAAHDAAAAAQQQPVWAPSGNAGAVAFAVQPVPELQQPSMQAAQQQQPAQFPANGSATATQQQPGTAGPSGGGAAAMVGQPAPQLQQLSTQQGGAPVTPDRRLQGEGQATEAGLARAAAMPTAGSSPPAPLKAQQGSMRQREAGGSGAVAQPSIEHASKGVGASLLVLGDSGQQQQQQQEEEQKEKAAWLVPGQPAPQGSIRVVGLPLMATRSLQPGLVPPFLHLPVSPPACTSLAGPVLGLLPLQLVPPGGIPSAIRELRPPGAAALAGRPPPPASHAAAVVAAARCAPGAVPEGVQGVVESVMAGWRPLLGGEQAEQEEGQGEVRGEGQGEGQLQEERQQDVGQREGQLQGDEGVAAEPMGQQGEAAAAAPPAAQMAALAGAKSPAAARDVQATAQPEASPEAEAAQASGQRAGSAAEQQAASSPGQLAAPEAEQQTAPAAELQAAPPAEEGTVPEPQGTPVAVEDAPKSLQPFAAPGPPLPEHEEMQAAVQCAVRAAAGAEAAGEAEEPQATTAPRQQQQQPAPPGTPLQPALPGGPAESPPQPASCLEATQAGGRTSSAAAAAGPSQLEGPVGGRGRDLEQGFIKEMHGGNAGEIEPMQMELRQVEGGVQSAQSGGQEVQAQDELARWLKVVRHSSANQLQEQQPQEPQEKQQQQQQPLACTPAATGAGPMPSVRPKLHDIKLRLRVSMKPPATQQQQQQQKQAAAAPKAPQEPAPGGKDMAAQSQQAQQAQQAQEPEVAASTAALCMEQQQEAQAQRPEAEAQLAAPGSECAAQQNEQQQHQQQQPEGAAGASTPDSQATALEPPQRQQQQEEGPKEPSEQDPQQQPAARGPHTATEGQVGHQEQGGERASPPPQPLVPLQELLQRGSLATAGKVLRQLLGDEEVALHFGGAAEGAQGIRRAASSGGGSSLAVPNDHNGDAARPYNLSGILAKLEGGRYRCISRFLSDLDHVWTTCRKQHALGSAERVAAQRAASLFEELWRKQKEGEEGAAACVVSKAPESSSRPSAPRQPSAVQQAPSAAAAGAAAAAAAAAPEAPRREAWVGMAGAQEALLPHASMISAAVRMVLRAAGGGGLSSMQLLPGKDGPAAMPAQGQSPAAVGGQGAEVSHKRSGDIALEDSGPKKRVRFLGEPPHQQPLASEEARAEMPRSVAHPSAAYAAAAAAAAAVAAAAAMVVTQPPQQLADVAAAQHAHKVKAVEAAAMDATQPPQQPAGVAAAMHPQKAEAAVGMAQAHHPAEAHELGGEELAGKAQQGSRPVEQQLQQQHSLLFPASVQVPQASSVEPQFEFRVMLNRLYAKSELVVGWQPTAAAAIRARELMLMNNAFCTARTAVLRREVGLQGLAALNATGLSRTDSRVAMEAARHLERAGLLPKLEKYRDDSEAWQRMSQWPWWLLRETLFSGRPGYKCQACGEAAAPPEQGREPTARRCEECGRTYHTCCLAKPQADLVAGMWYCPPCRTLLLEGVKHAADSSLPQPMAALGPVSPVRGSAAQQQRRADATTRDAVPPHKATQQHQKPARQQVELEHAKPPKSRRKRQRTADQPQAPGASAAAQVGQELRQQQLPPTLGSSLPPSAQQQLLPEVVGVQQQPAAVAVPPQLRSLPLPGVQQHQAQVVAAAQQQLAAPAQPQHMNKTAACALPEEVVAMVRDGFKDRGAVQAVLEYLEEEGLVDVGDLDYVDYEHMLAKLAQHGVTRLRIKRFQAAVGQRLPGGVLSKAPMQEVKQEPQL